MHCNYIDVVMKLIKNLILYLIKSILLNYYLCIIDSLNTNQELKIGHM